MFSNFLVSTIYLGGDPTLTVIGAAFLVALLATMLYALVEWFIYAVLPLRPARKHRARHLATRREQALQTARTLSGIRRSPR